ncbi:MAG: hypothetical protein JSR91_11385 [Proteobacteria bacterium]|nr:hypothetical protein [Pseudomonadota bacterium]
MGRSTVMRLCLLAATASLATGCTTYCSATDAKLSQLRRGMTYAEAAEVMGCNGWQMSRAKDDTGDVATVEWDGPGSRLAPRTQLDFRNGRLLSFTTGRRFGL